MWRFHQVRICGEGKLTKRRPTISSVEDESVPGGHHFSISQNVRGMKLSEKNERAIREVLR